MLVRAEELAKQNRKLLRQVKPQVASDTAKTLSSRGRFERLGMGNSLESGVGILLPLNGNPDELVYIGQI